MSLKRDFDLFLIVWHKLTSKGKLEIIRTLSITLIFNLFELINIFLAGSFAFIISGNTLENSEKLGFLSSLLNLTELGFVEQLKIVGVLFAISSLSYSIFSIVSLKDRVLTSAKISTLLTEKALRNIFHTKYSFFANYKKEKIINNVLTEASVVTTSVLRPLFDQISSLIIILCLMSFWLYYDYKSACIVAFLVI